MNSRTFWLLLALMPGVACADARPPIPAQKGIELWQRYCMSYSQDYRQIVQFFRGFNEFDELNEGYFAAKKVAFDVVFMPFEDTGQGPCTVTFLPVENATYAKSLFEKQIYTLDAQAFTNRDGQFHFILMAARFTAIPSFDTNDNVVSLTLIRE